MVGLWLFFFFPSPSQRKSGAGSRDVTFGFGFRSLEHWDVPRAVLFDTGFFELSPTIGGIDVCSAHYYETS